MFTASTILGVIGGCACSLTLKLLKLCKLNRTQETSLIIFFAFLTYSCTELLGYSPIISLLFCGIILSHYAFYNLSFQSREESCIVSKIMSNIAEGFIFTYLGLTSITISHETFSFTFIFCILLFVLLGRLFAVYGISALFKLFCSRMFQFSFSDQGITFSTGCIRGAIAFGLALSMPNEKNKPLLISSTLILVFFTTVLFGAFMSSIVKFFSGTNKKKVPIDKEVFPLGQELERITLAQMEVCKNKADNQKADQNSAKPKTATKQIKGFWKKIDDKYIRPFLIDDWPDVKDDHQNIGKEIINILEDYQKNKIKKKVLQFTSKAISITNNETLLFNE